MIKALTTFSLLLTLAACSSQGISKDMLNKDLLDEAKPLYKSCLAEYKKTMSDDDAKKACTEKLKNSYKKITAA
jgi:hypothetical protein